MSVRDIEFFVPDLEDILQQHFGIPQFGKRYGLVFDVAEERWAERADGAGDRGAPRRDRRRGPRHETPGRPRRFLGSKRRNYTSIFVGFDRCLLPLVQGRTADQSRASSIQLWPAVNLR